MRQLTSKQKKVLDTFFESQKNEAFKDAPFAGISPFKGGKRVLMVDDLPTDIYTQLEKINFSEILHQEVDRYLMDKSNKYVHSK